jgi:hypothetical protein
VKTDAIRATEARIAPKKTPRVGGETTTKSSQRRDEKKVCFFESKVMS